MIKVVPFQPSTAAQEAVIAILEDALAEARAGKIADVAVVMAVRDEDGPQFVTAYYGDAAYGTIIAGVSALEFDLHYQRYRDEEGE